MKLKQLQVAVVNAKACESDSRVLHRVDSSYLQRLALQTEKIGDADPDLLKDYQKQIDQFTIENEKIGDDIKNLNIKVISTFSKLTILPHSFVI